MLKFLPASAHHQDAHPTESCFSEYLGSHLFEAIGIPAQKTLLGTYPTEGDVESLVVACEDFIADSGRQLVTFLALKNSVFHTTDGPKGTELSDMLFAMDHQKNFDPVALRRFFWDMSVVDAFIADPHRHNGNWGFLYDAGTDTLEPAAVPVCFQNCPKRTSRVSSAIPTRVTYVSSGGQRRQSRSTASACAILISSRASKTRNAARRYAAWQNALISTQ